MIKTSRVMMITSVVYFCSLGVLLAQIQTATILGTIYDESGAIVPDVEVTVRRVETNETFVTRTNETGDYRVERVPVGDYVIQAVKSGFSTQERRGIKLEVTRAVRIDFRMTVGELNQRVEVTAAAPLISSEKAQLGQVIDYKKVEGLPQNARDFTQLAALAPGVTPTRGSVYGARGSFYVHGQRETANVTYVDGTMLSLRNGQTSFSPSLDAIQEFSILTANYGAEWGLGSGAQISAAIKSGGNTLHGSAFEFFRHDEITARNYFDRTASPRPFNRNQFGATVGGPIYIPRLINGKDKAWFFFSYQNVRTQQFVPLTGIVPTAAQKRGEFTSAITDPLTRQPFPNNTIPQNRIDRVSAALTRFWPDPNTAGALNYTAQNSQLRTTNPQYIVRIDLSTSEKSAWSGKFIYDWGPGAGLNAIPLFTSRQPLPNYLGSFSYTRTLSSRFVNTARADVNIQMQQLVASEPVEEKTAFMRALAIPGVPDTPPAVNGIPIVRVTGLLTLGDTCCTGTDYFAHYIVRDDMSMLFGNHSIKAGVEMRQYSLDVVEDFRPTFDFVPRYTGNAFADYLLGYPVRTSTVGTESLYNAYHRDYNFYVQDDWKATPKLTFNLGLRYERKGPWKDYSGFSRNWDPVTADFFPERVSGTSRTAPNFPLVTFSPKIFVPRLGVAFRVAEKTVVRGAYGLYTQEVLHRDGLRGIGLNPQEGRQINVFNASISTPDISFSNPFPPALLSSAIPNIWGIETPAPASYSNSWGLSIQHELSPDLLVEAAYQGNNTVHLLSWVSLNDAMPNTAANRQPFRPYPQWQFVQWISYEGTANHNGLLLKLEKRPTRDGFYWLGSFAWSHSLSNISSLGAGGEQNYRSRNVPISTQGGNSGTDIRRRLTLTGGYQLPFGAGKAFLKNGIGSKISGGWEIQGIATLQDGPWTTAFVAGDPLNTGSVWSQRPDVVGDVNLPSSSRIPEKWFDTTALARPAPLQYGNAGLGIIEGPGLVNVDLSIRRTFRITERHSIDFRAEAFNAFNHTNFRIPGTTLGTGNFGVIGSALDPRQFQFGLKYSF